MLACTNPDLKHLELIVKYSDGMDIQNAIGAYQSQYFMVI